MPHVFPLPANTLTALNTSAYACYGRDNSFMAITPNEGIALLLCGLDDILSKDAPPEAVKGTLSLLADYLNERSAFTNQAWFVDSSGRLDYHELTQPALLYKCRKCHCRLPKRPFGGVCPNCEAVANE